MNLDTLKYLSSKDVASTSFGMMVDYVAEVSAAYARRDRMLDALNTIMAYSIEQLIDKDAIHEITIAYSDLRAAIVEAAELEVQEYIAMHPVK